MIQENLNLKNKQKTLNYQAIRKDCCANRTRLREATEQRERLVREWQDDEMVTCGQKQTKETQFGRGQDDDDTGFPKGDEPGER